MSLNETLVFFLCLEMKSGIILKKEEAEARELGIRLLRSESEIDKLDGDGESCETSTTGKEDLQDLEYEKQEKFVTKGSGKRKSRASKELPTVRE